jgi:GNAT superfamily N-acetyltransferase
VNRDEVLALYDRFERREVVPVGRRLERTPFLTREIDAPGRPSWIAWSDLADADVDAVIAEEIAYWTALGQDVEWKLYAHDRPADLRERLLAAGFEADEEEALMALDLRQAPAWVEADGGHDVRAVDPESLDEVATVIAGVWPDELGRFLARYRDDGVAATERTRFFVAYDGAAPVAAGWTEASSAATPFLGLWAGAVLPSHRGRGLYRAVVAARARYARSCGYRFLTVDAGPMSRPILERLGFVHLTTVKACTWRHESCAHAPASQGRALEG